MHIDRYLPEYHIREFHRVTVKAEPAAVYEAARNLLPGEMPFPVKLMLMLRMVPAKLSGKKERAADPGRPFLDSFMDDGFIMLEEDGPRELVFGVIGQFWKCSPIVAAISGPREYVEFSHFGYAKVAANLAVTPGEGSVELSTETRIFAMDAGTLKLFSRYWRLISAGSGWIRTLWLGAIKRKAGRAGATGRG